jgi:hypothetical protein
MVIEIKDEEGRLLFHEDVDLVRCEHLSGVVKDLMVAKNATVGECLFVFSTFAEAMHEVATEGPLSLQ